MQGIHRTDGRRGGGRTQGAAAVRRFGPAGVVTRVAVSVWRRISFAAREGALQKLSPALGARAERGVPGGDRRRGREGGHYKTLARRGIFQRPPPRPRIPQRRLTPRRARG